METIAFWNQIYSELQIPPDMDLKPSASVNRAIDFFGGVEGKRVVDLGCGAGITSVHLAQRGATVLAVDNSVMAIQHLKAVCRRHGLDRIVPIHAEAMAIERIGTFDAVFGSMILHHLEPFDEFVTRLHIAMPIGGKGFFRENNAASRLLIRLRKHLTGRFWIPKRGDAKEFPLTLSEVATLRGRFDVAVEYPEMLFFRLGAEYVLNNYGRRTAAAVDEFLYRHNYGTSYSYRQWLMITKHA